MESRAGVGMDTKGSKGSGVDNSVESRSGWSGSCKRQRAGVRGGRGLSSCLMLDVRPGGRHYVYVPNVPSLSFSLPRSHTG